MFSFTETSYDVSEDAGPAVVVVELGGAHLTFPIDVTVETIAGGTATGTCYCGLIPSQFMHMLVIVETIHQRIHVETSLK